jgi:phosphotransferase system  glucose/maltose/N-acetylglucosamine-specific IIC component
MTKTNQTESSSGKALIDDLPDAMVNKRVTNIKSKGGDVVTEGGLIDKRSGGIYINEKSRPKGSKERKKLTLQVIAGLIIATVLSILSNIVATYFQEKYSLITDSSRFVIVLVIFLFVLIINIFIVLREIQN